MKQKSIIEMFLDGELDTITDNKILEFNRDLIGREFTLLTEGDFTLLFGPTSSGKSRIGAYFLRQFLLEKPDRYFVRKENGKKYVIVYVDTEMSGQNMLKYFVDDNFYEFKSIKEAIDKLQLKKRFQLLSYAEYDIEQRKIKLKEFISMINKEEYNYVFFLDNLASFTEDPNNTINNKVVNELKSILADFPVLVVLHSNHKDGSNRNNATGSIGTVMERLAANILQIANPVNQKFTLELKKSKSQPDKIKTQVCINQTEKNGKLIMNEIYEIDDSMGDDKKDNKRMSDEEISKMILSHLNKKAFNSDERQRKSVVQFLNPYYGKSRVYEIISSLKEKGKLNEENGYLRHIDEDPF